jgi:hypothetical protein
MFLVIGNTPQRVELKDLGDYVYYKQQKVFTEAQYIRSQDLQREIQKGSLSVLKRTAEASGSFEIPSVSFGTQDKTSAVESPKLDALMERIQSLEASIKAKSDTIQAPQVDALKAIEEKISKLETSAPVIQGSSGPDLSFLYDAIKGLEARIEKGTGSDALIARLEGILNRAPTAAAPVRPKEETRPEDVYIPNVTVEDANTHIKLNVRTIDSGDSVSDSLKKLKELKSKST